MMQILKPYIWVDFSVMDQPVIGVSIAGNNIKYISKFIDTADDTRSALVLTYQLTNNRADAVSIDDVIRTTDLRTVVYSTAKYPRITIRIMNGNTCVGTTSTYYLI